MEHPNGSGVTSAPDKLYTIDNFTNGDFTLRKDTLNWKILLHVFFFFFFFLVWCVDGVQCICALMVAILHIETFVIFDFDPSLILRLITDFDLNQIK